MAGLKLTVLGCCGSYPGRGMACSGYLLRTDATTVWMDAGSGSLANLQHHVRLADVDAVVLSHQHGDHWNDIDGYHVACAYGIDRSGVPIYGPAGLRSQLPERYSHFDFNVVEAEDKIRVGDIEFTFSRTQHPVDTLAMRVDGGGRSLVYSADTGPDWSIEALGSAFDLAVVETTYTIDQERADAIHLSSRQAGAQAKAAAAAELMVTHFWPTNSHEQTATEASEAYGKPVLVAMENHTYDV